MNAKDLTIGDWVLQCELNAPVKVQSIMCHYADEDVYFYHEAREYISNISKLEPIPLTEEILKKNGFENIPYAGIDCNKIWLLHEISYYGKSFPLHTDDIMLRYSTSGQCWRIFFNIGGVHSDFRTVTTIFYVHELQHLLKLCKIEKEIALQ